MSYKRGRRVPIAVPATRSIMEVNDHDTEEDIMSMQSEGKDAKGRNYDNVTKDGSTSIGTLGAGGTADVGRMAEAGNNQLAGGGNAQADSRTDDLLSDGSARDRGDGFVGEEAGELQTGMGGIGSLSTGNAGSRQSAQPGGESGAMRAGDAGGAKVPESGGQRTRK